MDGDLAIELTVLGAQLAAADELLAAARQTAEAAARRNPAFNYEPRLSVLLNSLRNVRRDVNGLTSSYEGHDPDWAATQELIRQEDERQR